MNEIRIAGMRNGKIEFCGNKRLKHMSYKKQIEQALSHKNWEIVEIDDSKEWWDDEHWKIRSKYNVATSFYLCFMVDPIFDGNRKKGQGISEIKATTQFPKNWNDDTHTIASIQMSKGKFDLKLQLFIDTLEQQMDG